jgi:hypothetical protein
VLVREYRGSSHEVTVVPGDFRWRGAVYPSLSAVARTISGTTWNGPRFFGLGEPMKSGPANEGERSDDQVPVRRKAPAKSVPGQIATGRSSAMSRQAGPMNRAEERPP